MAKKRDTPLRVEVVDEQLVIRIGIGTLAWAAEHQNDWNPFDDERNDFFQKWRVSGAKGFALDVAGQLLKEEEDGSSPLSDLLDKMSMEVVEDGAESVRECKPGTPSAYARDAKRRG
jgi:hypothetical protein